MDVHKSFDLLQLSYVLVLSRLSTLEECEYHTQDAHQDSLCVACLHSRYCYIINVAVILLPTSPEASVKMSHKF